MSKERKQILIVVIDRARARGKNFHRGEGSAEFVVF